MKKKSVLFGILIFIFAMLGIPKNIYAETVFKNGEVIKRTTTVLDGWGDKILYSFDYNPQDVYLLYIENIKMYYNSEKGTGKKNAIKIAIKRKVKNDMWDPDFDYDWCYDWKNVYTPLKGSEGDSGYVYHGDDLKFGKEYAFMLDNNTYQKYKVTYRIERYNGFSKNIKIKNSINVKIGDYKKINFISVSPYGSLPDVKWKSSNSKIAVAELYNTGYEVYGKRKGKCTLTGTLPNGKKIKCTVSVSTPAPYINYSSYEMYKSNTVNLKIMYSKGKVQWSSSNRNVAVVSSGGKVTAKGLGTCKIIGKCGNKKYYCTIKVFTQYPNFNAKIVRYNTRDNYFVVKFKNVSDKPVTIKASNMKILNVSYKSFDRNLCFPYNRDFVLNAGETREVPFHVKGSVTWYDYTDYTLYYYFVFDNQKYEGHVWYANSVYCRNNTWYKTYWKSSEKYFSTGLW